jgi:hypothetical protein
MMAHRHLDTQKSDMDLPLPMNTSKPLIQSPTIIQSALSASHEVDEFSGCIGQECGIHDSSELLLLNMILKQIVTDVNREWCHVVVELVVRMTVAFFYRTAIQWILGLLHIDLVLQYCIVHTPVLMLH